MSYYPVLQLDPNSTEYTKRINMLLTMIKKQRWEIEEISQSKKGRKPKPFPKLPNITEDKYIFNKNQDKFFKW